MLCGLALCGKHDVLQRKRCTLSVVWAGIVWKARCTTKKERHMSECTLKAALSGPLPPSLALRHPSSKPRFPAPSKPRFPAPQTSLSGTFPPSLTFRHLSSKPRFPASFLQTSLSGTFPPSLAFWHLSSKPRFPAPFLQALPSLLKCKRHLSAH